MSQILLAFRMEHLTLLLLLMESFFKITLLMVNLVWILRLLEMRLLIFPLSLIVLTDLKLALFLRRLLRVHLGLNLL